GCLLQFDDAAQIVASGVILQDGRARLLFEHVGRVRHPLLRLGDEARCLWDQSEQVMASVAEHVTDDDPHLRRVTGQSANRIRKLVIWSCRLRHHLRLIIAVVAWPCHGARLPWRRHAALRFSKQSTCQNACFSYASPSKPFATRRTRCADALRLIRRLSVRVFGVRVWLSLAQPGSAWLSLAQPGDASRR